MGECYIWFLTYNINFFLRISSFNFSHVGHALREISPNSID
jgi:hypothetical protein